MTRTDEKVKAALLDCLKHCMDDRCGDCRMSETGSRLPCADYAESNVAVPKSMLIAIREMLEAETVWEYCPDDEGRPRWRCQHCGKYVHKDPAFKLHCSVCGLRARKKA